MRRFRWQRRQLKTHQRSRGAALTVAGLAIAMVSAGVGGGDRNDPRWIGGAVRVARMRHHTAQLALGQHPQDAGSRRNSRVLRITPGCKRVGRVFIDDKEVYFVDRSSPQQHLCEVKWPKDVDVVSEIKGLRPKPKSVMTLQIRTPLKKVAAKR